MAEFLVKAKPNWRDNTPANVIAKMTVDEKKHFAMRHQEGDIIAVRPDGWVWGKKEGLPDFIIVKVPSLSYQEALDYKKDVEENVDIVKHSRFRINKGRIQQAVNTNNGIIELKSNEMDNLEDKNG